jgi:hypothetical protein
MLIPTEACLDWINSCDDDKMTLDEIVTVHTPESNEGAGWWAR